MCGIAGYFDQRSFTNTTVLTEMIGALSHRGPDFSSVVELNLSHVRIGLAHARLSIIDLSERSNQPMVFGDLTIVFNGEIYNFKEIRKELESEGHVFVTNSDTEVVLHAYQKWGKDCVGQFIGMFACVIVDRTNEKVVMFRDRAGVKPLYYYWDGSLFLFASELKAFHKHPQFIKVINSQAVHHFLQFGTVPGNTSIFKNVSKLQQGTILELDLRTWTTNKTVYWDVEWFYTKEKSVVSFEEALENTENILESAFNYRMISDVPVGVFLSSGYDSVLLAAILQKSSMSKINTYTIGVDDAEMNEAPMARQIAQRLGTSHHEINCTQSDFMELVNGLPNVFDEPFADSSAIPTLMVSKLASREVKVALSADGGDEIFAGYNRYDRLKSYGESLIHMPKALSRSLDLLVCNRVVNSIVPHKHQNSYEKLCSLLQAPDIVTFMHNLNSAYTKNELNKLFSDRQVKAFAYNEFYNTKPKSISSLSFMMMMDYKLYLADDILQKVDRCSMAYGLEAREPFLDHRIIEWVATLPDDFKYKNGIKKYILKEITHKYVSKEMMNRPKMGFSVPLNKWLKEELKELVHDNLNSAAIKQHDLFDATFVQQLLDKFYNHDQSWLGLRIWNILCFQMWYKKWMS